MAKQALSEEKHVLLEKPMDLAFLLMGNRGEVSLYGDSGILTQQKNTKSVITELPPR